MFNPPSTGTYTVTVTGSGLDKINKPVQNYALASTHSLKILPAPFLNAPPIAQPDVIIINPHWKEPAIVRLTGADQNDDPISFSVSRDPSHGTVSTDEQITKTSSRMFYNASSGFVTRDTFEVTPQDGLVSGTAATITILAESLPPGANGNAALDWTAVKKWDTLVVMQGYAHSKYSSTFSGPGYPISAIYAGSVNMEGVDMRIATTSGHTYTAAVPPSGDRMITFASPLSLRSVVLSADGLDEESAHDIVNKKPIPRKSARHSASLYDDVRMFVGYVPASCTDGASSGAQGAQSSCPAYTTYQASSSPSLSIPDNMRVQGTSDTMLVPVNGTLKSVSASVDISHTHIGDLRVELSSPGGKTVVLHDRAGGGSDGIKRTYDLTTAVRSMLGPAVAGNWTITVGDYSGGDIGALNSWSISLQYEPSPVRVTPGDSGMAGTPITVFHDDFESGTLAKWTQTGEGDWTITTSQTHRVPTIPGHDRGNKILHSDDCDGSCTVTTKGAIDLSEYKSATLSFWRFVDSGLDGSEYLRVDVSDGTMWSTIYHWSANNKGDDGRWHHETYDMSQYAGKPSVGLRFVTQQSAANEDVQVDNVVINASKAGTTTVTNPATPPSTAAAHSVYVVDTDDYEILAYSQSGAYLGDVIQRKSAGLGKPFDAAFGPDGHLYVSDNTHSKIRKYNSATGASLGKTAANAEWASTVGIPNGMVWHNDTLYVATLKGVEKISSTGSHQGYFGDASETPSTAGAPKLVSPYDVGFCPDGLMYVADLSLGRVIYYDAATGKYRGSVPDTPQNTQPVMRKAAGLECGPAIAGATGTTSIYQSGDDPGRVNEISPSTKKLLRQFTSLIDEPYGMDSDPAGNLYVANKDDDNIIRISPSGSSAVFATGSLDDPRGVMVGPEYVATSPTSGEGTKPRPQDRSNDNDGPEPVLKNGTAPSPSRMAITTNSSITLGVTATDPEGDPVTFDLVPHAIPSAAVSITDHRNGTGAVSINTSGMDAGTYAFVITAHDGQNLERAIYTVEVTP